jgi:hypothetical protein
MFKIPNDSSYEDLILLVPDGSVTNMYNFRV